MNAPIPRALMSLAGSCLGESRHDWACAMEAEFELAVEDGRPLAFAVGCLIAASRELPRNAEGRLTLVNHMLALGLLIPMAVFQVTRGLGTVAGLVGPAGISGDASNAYLAWARSSAAPVLLILWVLIGIGHLRLAWVLVERDWDRVVKVGALIAAAAVTLFLFMGVLFLDLATLIAQSGAMATELAFIIAAARSDARRFPIPST